jgi:O-antigen/teichoic acid export membrane protein
MKTNNLPYPKSFPNKEETDFLKMALSADDVFPQLWQSWKNSVDWYAMHPAIANLMPFIYLRLKKNNIKDEFTDRMRGIHKSTWIKNQLFIQAAKEVAEVCKQENIPLLALKGIPLLLDIYEDAGARSLGDADLMIHPEDGIILTRKLIHRGWSFVKRWAAERHNPSSGVYRIIKASELINQHGTAVDLHYNIFAADHGIRPISVFLLRDMPSILFPERLWKYSIPMNFYGMPMSRLSNEDMVIHLMVHGSEGNMKRTLRWILDAASVIKKGPISWPLVLEHAREFGYALELKLAFAYMKENFDLPIPESFLKELSAMPVKKAEIRKYYKIANTEHTRRLKLLGNIPLLWYAYWKFEPPAPALKKFFGFPRYLLKAWGLKKYRELFGFALFHLKRKISDRDPQLLGNAGKALRDSAYIIGGKAIAFLASFAVVSVLGRLIPRETVGSYNYIVATLSIISISTLPGMNNALARAIGRGNDGSVSTIMKKRLLYGTIGSALALLIGVSFWLEGNTGLGLAFFIAAPFVPLTDTFSSAAISFWQGKKRFDRSATMFAVYYVGLAILSIAVFLISKNLPVMVAGVMLAQTIMGLSVYKSIRRDNAKDDPESVKLGMHLTVMQALSILSGNLDRVIVWTLMGPATLAAYSFAATPISKAYQMIPVGTIALPHLSGRAFTKEIKRGVLRKMKLLFIIFIPVTIFIIWLAPFLYRIFFPLYPDSVPYFQLLFLGVIFSPLAIVKSALIAFKKTRTLYITEVIVPAFKIVLMAVLAVLFGIYGLIYGVLISAVIGFVVALVLFLRSKTEDA